MKTIEIKGSFRKELGKKSSKLLRRSGDVPCVIYGKEENIHFYAPELSFKNLVYTPAAHLVRLVIDDKVYDAILHDMQFHPVKDNILHADFIQIHDNVPVVINIPIKVSGDSIGVIAGGKLSIKRRNLKVKGLSKDLPEALNIDITNLKIHEGVKVGDLTYEGIELLDPKKSLVLTIATSRVAQKSEEATGTEAEGEAAPAAAPAPEK
jgi:large subunit ribosomal protein L25